ncbi:MCP four helix bundle domain-containing protein [Undibacterium sp. TS12]|uniref:MCP four helix bundle domain-containing protein n=1 Tax=Undibacterium sp. TS12 TaxID=2908202 RepID=UPI001F4D1E45|nr:MCP four helix bundle domain-containing protein [Undibacterium sp. TS12]MCH8622487.1 MCP four helix bundle domain-containing protein [Undibacterium sp. TS12]
MKFSNLKISLQLGIAYGLILFLLTAVGSFGIYSLYQSNETMQQATAANVKKTELLQDMAASVHAMSRAMQTIALLTDETAFGAEQAAIETARKNYDTAYAMLSTLPLDDRATALLGAIGADQFAAQARYAQFIATFRTDRSRATALLLKTLTPATTQWQNEISQLLRLQEVSRQNEEAVARQTYQTALTVLAGLVILAVTVACYIAWSSARSITTPLTRAIQLARSIASGNLGNDLAISTETSAGPGTNASGSAKTDNETTQLLRSLQDMNNNLVQSLVDVRATATAMALASAQTAADNRTLASRNEKQADSLLASFPVLKDLTALVARNTEHAKRARSVITSASSGAQRSSYTLMQLGLTEDAIEASSDKINGLLEQIDDLVLKANMLALDASAEVIEGSEQENDMAQIATRVNELAQSSATVATDIKVLLAESARMFNTGRRLISQAGNSVGEVVRSVQDATVLIEEINASASLQGAGLVQVRQTMDNANELLQHNALALAESAEAAKAMQARAHSMSQLIARFKLGNTAGSVHVVNTDSTDGTDSHGSSSGTPATGNKLADAGTRYQAAQSRHPIIEMPKRARPTLRLAASGGQRR